MSSTRLTSLAAVVGASALALFIRPVIGQQPNAPTSTYGGWGTFGGTPDNIHYSTLNQINRENVQSLRMAWTYDTGDAFPESEMECNPIIVHGILYATTPRLRVIALDAATGKPKWSFDPSPDEKSPEKSRN